MLVCSLKGYELQKEYFFTDTTVTSSDLFPDVPKRFEIVRIPSDKHLYRLDANVVARTFELHGILIDTKGVRYVSFVKKSPVDTTLLQQQLEQKLRQCHPRIRIESITITPRGYLESLPADTEGVFDAKTCKNSSGTFFVQNGKGLRHYLDYSVVASLPILHTAQKVSRKEPLSGLNTLLKQVPFGSFRDVPLTTFPQTPSRFRSSLKSGTPLMTGHIEALPLVLKNDKVVAEVKNGAVVLEIIATATQEGSLYDIITIQKRDGKRSKAKVIGEKRVELQ